VKISGDRAFIKSLGGGKTVAIKEVLKYQACDDPLPGDEQLGSQFLQSHYKRAPLLE
jgi:hypothetical protein